MEELTKSLVLGLPVLISDDDEFFRLALRNILIDRLGVSKVIETSTFDEAIETMSRQPGLRLALFDLNMPGMNNWDDLRSVRETFPDVLIAVVSASRERGDMLRALDAGVHGYVLKGLGVTELAQALRLICAGKIYVPASLPDMACAPQGAAPSYPSNSFSGDEEGPGGHADGELRRLTPRQKEVLVMLVAGQSNKAIARRLELSEGTIKFHISAVFRVLGATNRVEAATAGGRLLKQMADRNEGHVP
jgi:DNA-binding NarL/FixJ family response regulator